MVGISLIKTLIYVVNISGMLYVVFCVIETMDGGRRTSTIRQLESLVEFAEANNDLARRLRSKAIKTSWGESAETLNSESPARLPKEWTKVSTQPIVYT